MTTPTTKPTKAAPRKAANGRTPIAEEAPPSVVVALVWEKETKSTVRFKATTDTAPVGILYVPKTTLAQLGNPVTLLLTLTAGATDEN